MKLKVVRINKNCKLLWYFENNLKNNWDNGKIKNSIKDNFENNNNDNIPTKIKFRGNVNKSFKYFIVKSKKESN